MIAVGGRTQVQGVKEGVLPEPSIRIFNFHTTGHTVVHRTSYRIPRVIDGGAVVNLMPETVARRLGLELVENNDIMIKTATNEIRKVKYCTRFNIDIVGVIANIKVYVLDIPQSYLLLLDRR